MYKNKISAVVFLVLLIIVVLATYSFYLGPVSKNSDTKPIEVVNGSSYLTIDPLLKKNNLIKSTFFYKLYIKLSNPQPLKAGIYYLSEDMGTKEIVNVLSSGNAIDPVTITITFKEGLNMRGVAKVIAANTNNTEKSVYKILKDKKYLNQLIEKYWFLTDDIKSEKVYYPLEGYLFPNTYEFYSKDVSVKEIFEVMLDEMDKQFKPFKNAVENSKYEIHEIITLASMIELEASNDSDRRDVSGVFYNRLEVGMTLGSDVTGYYGAKMDDWTNGLGVHIYDCNGYNTRGDCVSGIPVGPIANPGIESIRAAVKPINHQYYYFVADCSGKTYLNSNEFGHNQTINRLRREGKWCDV
ncbi:MAG TPA: endolytic transglycosylase MltG [Mollicutes bacterium]|nr:endolytic transglycosylase MltG [Mollicutes bacterium]